jgi:multicomponent K+:H+ antiporter subunit E
VRRLLPHPLLSTVLLLMWLALNNSAAPAHVVLGALFAWALPLAGLHLADGAWPRVHRPGLVLILALRVLWDIIVSNYVVMRRVLGPDASIRPGFVRVPLELSDDWAVTALACIVTMTPGTLTADVAPDRSYLLVHAFHIDDADVIIASVKTRYEAPLKEIFG